MADLCVLCLVSASTASLAVFVSAMIKASDEIILRFIFLMNLSVAMSVLFAVIVSF